MIKLTDLLKESPESSYAPYMYSPIGFSCAVCKYHYIEDGKHKCKNKYYQDYISNEFLALEDVAELVDTNGNPIEDPTKWCSNWFMPKGK